MKRPSSTSRTSDEQGVGDTGPPRRTADVPPVGQDHDIWMSARTPVRRRPSIPRSHLGYHGGGRGRSVAHEEELRRLLGTMAATGTWPPSRSHVTIRVTSAARSAAVPPRLGAARASANDHHPRAATGSGEGTDSPGAGVLDQPTPGQGPSGPPLRLHERQLADLGGRVGRADGEIGAAICPEHAPRRGPRRSHCTAGRVPVGPTDVGLGRGRVPNFLLFFAPRGFSSVRPSNSPPYSISKGNTIVYHGDPLQSSQHPIHRSTYVMNPPP